MLRSKIQWFMQITVPLANKPFSTYHASLNRISDFVYVILSASRQSYMPNSSLGAMIENASGHHPVVTHLEDKNAWQLERPQSKAFCPEGPWMGWVGSVGFREVRIFNPPSPPLCFRPPHIVGHATRLARISPERSALFRGFVQQAKHRSCWENDCQWCNVCMLLQHTCNIVSLHVTACRVRSVFENYQN